MVIAAFFSDKQGAIVSGEMFLGNFKRNFNNLGLANSACHLVGAHHLSVPRMDSKFYKPSFQGRVFKRTDSDSYHVISNRPTMGNLEAYEVVSVIARHNG